MKRERAPEGIAQDPGGTGLRAVAGADQRVQLLFEKGEELIGPAWRRRRVRRHRLGHNFRDGILHGVVAAASVRTAFGIIDPDEQLKVWIELDDADEVVWAIVHSHVASQAVPSATDVGLAFYPDSLYVIVSLADPKSPSVRAWSIREGSVSEVALVVTA